MRRRISVDVLVHGDFSVRTKPWWLISLGMDYSDPILRIAWCIMNLIVLLIILLLLFGGGGFYLGGPYVGGGLGTVLLVILIIVVVRGL